MTAIVERKKTGVLKNNLLFFFLWNEASSKADGEHPLDITGIVLEKDYECIAKNIWYA